MNERFSLPARIDAADADALVAALLARRGAPLTVDAGEVVSISALAVEVIIAAGKQWQDEGHSLAIANGSAEFLATCATLGLCPQAPWRALSTQPGGLGAAA